MSASDPVTTFEGHSSGDIANAIKNYIAQNQDRPWSARLSEAVLPETAASKEAVQYATVSDRSSTFSLAVQIQAHQWIQIVVCILWIALGLLLVFYGWSSIFWTLRRSNRTARLSSKTSIKNKSCLASSPLSIGGVCVGFLFGSFFSIVAASAVCVSHNKSIASIPLFVMWLACALFSAGIGGHWPLISCAFTGVLAGACTTVLSTAMFGIHTLAIRAIFFSVVTSVITILGLVPRPSWMYFHVNNICTSVIGMVTFLDGVALFAPPAASSTSWIDLWVLLFAADSSKFVDSTAESWGSSSFKGYVAGAVLGTFVGFAFEYVLHKEASHDEDEQWNEYLGRYTQRLEQNGRTDMHDRAGVFQPAPSPWQSLSNMFSSSKGPAIYGDLPVRNEAAQLTELYRQKRSRRSGIRSTRPRSGPAKFEALSQRGEDLEEGEYDSDADSISFGSTGQLPFETQLRSPAYQERLYEKRGQAGLFHLNEEPERIGSPQPPSFPRPPSYRTSSSNSGVDATSPTKSTRFESTDSPLFSTVSVTPSLLNAIARIQVAQAQVHAESALKS